PLAQAAADARQVPAAPALLLQQTCPVAHWLLPQLTPWVFPAARSARARSCPMEPLRSLGECARSPDAPARSTSVPTSGLGRVQEDRLRSAAQIGNRRKASLAWPISLSYHVTTDGV